MERTEGGGASGGLMRVMGERKRWTWMDRVPATEDHQGATRDVCPKEECAKLGLSRDKKMVLHF